ncbi:predicted protein, partial [Nematostella vectensis]
IDNLLRCSICFEYFDIPVMVQECSHNYCSVCIRRSITFDTQCPTCHMKTVQQDLRCNRVLDELVKNFIAVRYYISYCILSCVLMAMCSQVRYLGTKTSAADKPEISNHRKYLIMRQNSVQSPLYRKAQGNIVFHQQSRTTPSVTPGRKRKRRIIDSDDEDKTFEAITIKQEPESECPVCGELILQSKVNSHLDLCLTRNEKKEALRSSNSPPTVQKRKPLPKLVYTLLSDKQLKQKLRECGLPTQGPREKLIKTHREYVTLYNAQCDSANPMSGAMIIKQMEQNEKKKIKLTEASTSDSSV